MDLETLRVGMDDYGVMTLTLNRPDRLNAFTTRMGRELIDVFDRADRDDAVRVVVVTGAGRGFCAGADLASGGSTFDARDAEGRQTAVARDEGGLVSLRIFDSKKPVIAAINGPAVGVGSGWGLGCGARHPPKKQDFENKHRDTRFTCQG